jgi:hypothetical protein
MAPGDLLDQFLLRVDIHLQPLAQLLLKIAHVLIPYSNILTPNYKLHSSSGKAPYLAVPMPPTGLIFHVFFLHRKAPAWYHEVSQYFPKKPRMVVVPVPAGSESKSYFILN